MQPTSHTVDITPGCLAIDGVVIDIPGDADTFITNIYRTYIGDYPKFYKMDAMTRLGFVGADLLMRRLDPDTRAMCDIITFSRHASLAADTAYCATIHPDDYYPAPALFVYTLPNILTGEIAIRHKCYGETCHYVTQTLDDAYMSMLVMPSMRRAVIYGSVDYISPRQYWCHLTFHTNL